MTSHILQNQDTPRFKDHLFFFYGTLTLPHVLKRVLRLADLPVVQPAQIKGYKIKMWGQYPTLVDADDPNHIVHGATYTVTSSKHLQTLIWYETEAYRHQQCAINMIGDGLDDTVVEGWTFVWNGNVKELEEGHFDPTEFPSDDDSE